MKIQNIKDDYYERINLINKDDREFILKLIDEYKQVSCEDMKKEILKIIKLYTNPVFWFTNNLKGNK